MPTVGKVVAQPAGFRVGIYGREEGEETKEGARERQRQGRTQGIVQPRRIWKEEHENRTEAQKEELSPASQRV